MYFIINMEEIIFLIIILILITGLVLWKLFSHIRHTINKKTKLNTLQINKEKAAEIIDEFEELLVVNDIKIPNLERKGNKDESCIYGSDYYNLEEAIIEILNE